jgi:hypothetical protein
MSIHLGRRNTFLMHVCLMSVIIGTPLSHAAELPREFDIRTVWRDTERAVQSARIRWTEEQVRPGASVTMPDGQTIQVDQQAFETEYYLAFHGTHFRFERTGAVPSVVGGGPAELAARTIINVSNGRQHRSVTTGENMPFPKGTILGAENRSIALNDIVVQPPLFAFRMLEPRMRPFDTSKNFRNDKSDLDGKPVYKLVYPGKSQELRHILLVDPELGFSIVRYALEKRGRVTLQMDISYRRNEEVGIVVPTGWKTTRLSESGEIRSETIADVKECTLNPKLDADEFEITFPHGTLIDGRILGQQYLARVDGSNRRVTAAELRAGIPVQQLLKTEPGESFPRNRPYWTFMLLASGVVMATLAVFLVLKRVRRC